MRIKSLPAGFVVPAQPIKASKPPSGPDWVHEIKQDGYRLIVRRDGATVRLYTRNAYDWTVRLPAIAAAAGQIKAKSFTIDGEAVVLGPDGLSRFDELRRREAAHSAMLYAFDLIEHDIPYLAGYSQDGKTIYIDQHMPPSFKFIEIRRGQHTAQLLVFRVADVEIGEGQFQNRLLVVPMVALRFESVGQHEKIDGIFFFEGLIDSETVAAALRHPLFQRLVSRFRIENPFRLSPKHDCIVGFILDGL
jgi:hypothetical protein